MKVFRKGRIHVLREKCATCIFRPGNLMHLRPGRVREMVDETKRNKSCIICHETLGTRRPAVCRGFYDKHATLALKIAESMGCIEWQQPPEVKP